MNTKPGIYSIFRLSLAFTVLGGMLNGSTQPALAATQFDIHGPAGSVLFGISVVVLPTGNIVVTDPYYNGGIGVDAGAAYLYNGATGALISMLTGLKAGDQVGSGGVTVLSNGNYLVSSYHWHNGAVADAGAVTWGNGLTGVSGAVTTANSLVGTHTADNIGFTQVTALTNGNYVVSSPIWDNGATADAGAVTWGDGLTGVSGAVTTANSLVGTHTNDHVGNSGAIALGNGNYLVRSVNWDNAATVDAGAVTWGNGLSGVAGVVTAANSLVGSTANDAIGFDGVTVLSNGNYVVRSSSWDNGANPGVGAATWGSGTSGISGAVSAANSLVGSHAFDGVGGDVTALSNGNYVVVSSQWDNGGNVDAGAATWGSGLSGVAGLVSAANSLVGSTASDAIGLGSVTALSNGNYVVKSRIWDNGAIANAGAATWGSGTTGVAGPVTALNSLVGSHASDQVGSADVTALSNGNYVVISPYWDNGAIANAGAVTWGSGTTGVAGPLSAINSLVGSQVNDGVGSDYVTPLSNGNYVVCSSFWDNGLTADAGAVTWGSGTTGVAGPVSSANSLVGSTASDQVGIGVTPLVNGNYVVKSRIWDNGGTVDAGAVTWGDGLSGVAGPVSAANSLVGSHANDNVGLYGVTPLSNGNYVVSSSRWDNGLTADAGAATWGNGTSGIAGAVSNLNSLVGTNASDQVGFGVTPLVNGNYVVSSYLWYNSASLQVGAVTWGDGLSGVSGAVTALNSLVGSTASDQVGFDGATALSNGTYAVYSRYWDNALIVDAGAVSWGFRSSGAVGPVSADNSVRGLAAGGGSAMVFQYDGTNHQLVVGRPYDNIVTLFKLDSVYLPVVRK
jgi:hypothetical protein